MNRLRRLLTLMSLVAVVGLMSLPLAALAVKPAPTPPGNHLNITEVAADFGMSTLIITGEHFSFGNTLEVTLGEFGPLNIVGVPTDTVIVVDFPAGGLPAGDYLLTVSKGTGQSQNDEYDLTIGAVGPPGPPGAAGMNGMDGMKGDKGDPGTPASALRFYISSSVDLRTPKDNFHTVADVSCDAGDQAIGPSHYEQASLHTANMPNTLVTPRGTGPERRQPPLGL